MFAGKTLLKLVFALVLAPILLSSVSLAQECMDGYIDFGTGDADDACHNVYGWYQTNGEDKWMTLGGEQTVDFWTDYPNEAHVLTFKHYDGLCDDSFSVYVNDYNVFSYEHGTSSGATTEEVSIPAYMIYSNIVTVQFTNTATDTCGHAGIDWIELEKVSGSSSNGEDCNSDSDCESENCNNFICCEYGKYCCVDEYDCSSDEVCGEDYYCIEESGNPNGESCYYNSECESGNCENGICCSYGYTCCQDSGDCYSGQTCGNNYYCEDQPCCGTKELCEYCDYSSECESGYCKVFDDGNYRCTTSTHPDVGCCPDGHHIEHPVVGTDCCTSTGCDSGYTCVNYRCAAGGGYCGDGTCGATETSSSCPSDCGGYCGDGTCSITETSSSCPSDCGGGGTQTGQCTTADCTKTIQCLDTISGCMLSIGTMIPCVKSTLTGAALASDACELASRVQRGDPVGVVITGIFTVLDIEDAAEEIIPCNIAPPLVAKDIVVGTLSCLEGIVYSALEDCGGYTGCAIKIINRIREMKESAVAVFVGSPVDVTVDGMKIQNGEVVNRPKGAYMFKTPTGETFALLTQATGNVPITVTGNSEIPSGQTVAFHITTAVIDKGNMVSNTSTATTIMRGENVPFQLSVPAGFGRQAGKTSQPSQIPTEIIIALVVIGAVAVIIAKMKGVGKGAALEAKPAKQAKIAKPRAAPAKPTKPAGKFCQSCGATLQKGSQFCEKCGKRA